MRLSKRLLFLLAISFLASGVSAHEEKHQHPAGKPEDFGSVHFPVSCTPAAQKQFGRAVAILHSFGYQLAEKAFSGVVASDSGCAMGYWGIAMSLYHPIWYPPDGESLKKGWAAVEKAKSVGAKTDRERDYIGAIEVFYKDSDRLDHGTRAVSYEKAIEGVYRRYPEDREAAAFYGLALLSTAPATDKTYANQKKAADILEKVFTEEPRHPGAAHYIIHSFDSPALAARALSAARSYAKIAPSASHALHMPSHIFTRLGLWQESIDSNRASAAAAKQEAIQLKMAGTHGQQLHAMDYLEYAYLQGGRDAEAKRVVDELASFSKAEPETLTEGYAFAAIPARYAIERGRWSEAASLALRPSAFPWDRFPYAEAVTRFGRALGAARSADLAGARKEVERLQSLHDEQAKVKEGYNFADQVEILRREAAASLAQADGRKEEAVKLLRSAAELEDSTEKHPVTPGAILPAHELLGDLFLELHQPADALREFEASLQASPNRFHGLSGAARAAQAAGDRQKAQALYTKLLAVCDRADGARPEVTEARAYLASK